MSKLRRVGIGMTITVSLWFLLSAPAMARPASQDDDAQARARALSEEASQLVGQRDYRAALDKLEEALGLYQELGARQDEAITLYSIGTIYIYLREYEQALTYYEPAVSLAQETGDLALQARILGNMGVIFHDMGLLEEALDRLGQALAIAREAGDRSTEGKLLGVMGSVYQSLDQSEEALAHLQEALAIFQDLGERAQQAMTLSHVGAAYSLMGQYDQALQTYEQALAIAQEIDDLAGQATLLDNMGLVLASLGHCTEALAHHEQAQTLHHSTGNLAGEGRSLMGLGMANSCLGEYERALANLYQALEVWCEIGDRKAEAEALGNIGLTYDMQGRYEQALGAFHETLAIFEALADTRGTGTTLANLGLVHRHLSQHQQAVAYYEQALAIFQERGNQQALASTLLNLGTAYGVVGQAGPALETLQQAIELYRAGGDRKGEMAALNNTGAVRVDLAQYKEAVDAFERALAIARETEEIVGEGAALNNLGVMYTKMDQYEEALETLTQALTIRQGLGDLAGQSRTLQNVGSVYETRGERLQAIDWYERSVVALESIQGEMRVEEFKASLVAERASVYASLIHLLAAESRSASAFNYSERARARAFLDRIGNQQVDYRQDAALELIEEEQALRQQVVALQRALDKERAKPYEEHSPELLDALSRNLEQARDKYQQLLTRLKLASPEYASLVSVSALNLKEVRDQVLDEGTTLIEYFVLDDQVLAWVIDQEGFELVALDISRDELHNRIGFLQDLIASRDFDAEVAADLYDVLFSPLKSHIRHANLVIVPHGVLHYLPFAALWDAKHERYLVEDYALTYAPSASTLKFILDKRNPDEGRLLALGNPDGSLPQSEAEAEAIAGLYDATPLLRGEASESQVYAQSGQVDLLHLAAHGVYNPFNPLYSRIELAADDAQDGNLEVHEVFGLDLAGVNLVVLSACQTALGEQSEGDELVGLTRAFLYAGAPAVVTTLWPIDDEASGALMEAFYSHLREGLTNAEALRAAQLEVCAEEGWSEPYYWAAFSLTGDYLGSGEPGVGMGSTPEPTQAALGVEMPTRVPAVEPSPTPGAGRGRLCAGAALPLGLVLLVSAGWLHVHRRARP